MESIVEEYREYQTFGRGYTQKLFLALGGN